MDMARDASAEKSTKVQRGIRSLETGGAILKAMALSQEPMKLRDLAELVDMAPAQLHPYLVSLRLIDMVEQTETGLYQLGPFALELGLTRLRAQDAYHEAIRRVGTLAQETRLMVALSVWGLHGVTIVHVTEGSAALHANVRAGGSFMMTTTATGRLFAAFHSSALTEPVIAREISETITDRSTKFDEARYRADVEAVRLRGYETTRDLPIPGVSAITAPVFDYSNAMQLAVTVIGPTPQIDLSEEGETVLTTLAFTEKLSADLGYRNSA
jgi:DNA-binding IclR family transcriptional regulator